MYGFVAKSIQHFLVTAYGAEVWARIASVAGVSEDGFESMQVYPDALPMAVLEAASADLDRPPPELLEDIGTHLMTHPDTETVRRLLRFGGDSFEDILWSLEDLDARARLAMPDMDLPNFRLRDTGGGTYQLCVAWPSVGEHGDALAAPLVLGMLRALSDDCGALVVMDLCQGGNDGAQAISIHLVESAFSSGRAFHLSPVFDVETAMPKAAGDVNPLPAMSFSAGKDCGACGRNWTATLDRLHPLHFQVALDGTVRHVGPTLARICGDFVGAALDQVFTIERPDIKRPDANFADLIGAQLQVRLKVGAGDDSFRATIEPLPEAGWLICLAPGPSISAQIEKHALTMGDFGICDPTIEMLFVIEANRAAMSESAQLNQRLDAARAQAETQAATDKLTGLFNRRAMDARLAELKHSDLDVRFGLMQMDLDFFKQVNDTHGHAAGDFVLRQVADILKSEVRAGDIVARVGGDEFVLLFPDCPVIPKLDAIARRIIERLSVPMDYDGITCRVSASIGTTVSSFYDSPDPETMMSDADIALYASKNAGRSRHTVFSPKLLQA